MKRESILIQQASKQRTVMGAKLFGITHKLFLGRYGEEAKRIHRAICCFVKFRRTYQMRHEFCQTSEFLTSLLSNK